MNKYIAAISNNLLFFLVNTTFFIVITPLTIKVMGDDFFGLWSILYAILLFSNIGTLGITSIVNKFSAEVQTDEPLREYKFGEIITGGALIVLPMAALMASAYIGSRSFIASSLAITPEWQDQFSDALILIALSIFPLFFSKVIQGFLLSQLENKLVRQIDILTSMVLWVGVILIVKFFRKDLVLVAYWCVFYSGLTFVLHVWALVSRMRFHFVISPAKIRRMLSFSGFMFVESLAIALFQQTDRVIVGITLGPALAGVYSVGTSIGLRMSMVVGQATEVMIPYASLKDSTNNQMSLYSVFRKLSQYISLLVAGFGGILVLWMDEILSLWISPAYAARYSHIFGLFIVGYGLLSLSRPAHQTLTGIGKVKVTSFLYSISTISMLITLYFLSRYFGLLGAALANLVPALLLLMNLYTYYERSGGMALKEIFKDLKWGAFLPPFMLALGLLAEPFWLKLLVTIALGSFVGIYIFKDDWAQAWLINQIKRLVHRRASFT